MAVSKTSAGPFDDVTHEPDTPLPLSFDDLQVDPYGRSHGAPHRWFVIVNTEGRSYRVGVQTGTAPSNSVMRAVDEILASISFTSTPTPTPDLASGSPSPQ